jgi:hypothetical protein
MTQHNFRKFSANIGDFKFFYTIDLARRDIGKAEVRLKRSASFLPTYPWRILLMLVTISGLVGRAPQCLSDDRSILEAALAVPTSDGKDWFALRFTNASVEAAQAIRRGDTIAVTGVFTFEPLPDGSVAPFKPVVAVLDLQLCDLPVAY